jgi:RNA polymerase sigma factor (sigma-70 family)
LEFEQFDAEYVRKLTAGDPATEAHFSAYFEKFLSMKLRSRRIPPSMAEDVRQETLLRVLKTLRQGSGVSQPERFGGFVNSVCNNVLLEFSHRQARDGVPGEDPPDVADTRMDVNASLISDERKRLVGEILDELVPKDREILRLVFFEDADRKRISEEMKVEPDYLRVLLHRAKAKFHAAYVRKHGRLTTPLLLFLCNAAGMKVTS